MRKLIQSAYRTKLGYYLLNALAAIIASPFLLLGLFGALLYYSSKILLILSYVFMGHFESAKVECSDWSLMVDVSDALK